MQAHNTVQRDRDISAHPELKLARWAARELSPETAGGHHDVHQLPAVRHVHRRDRPVRPGPCRLRVIHRAVVALNPGGGFAPVPQEGPLLYAEARAAEDGDYT